MVNKEERKESELLVYTDCLQPLCDRCDSRATGVTGVTHLLQGAGLVLQVGLVSSHSWAPLKMSSCKQTKSKHVP